MAIPGDVPDAVSRTVVDPRALPAGWRRYPGPEALAELGTRWAARGHTALLLVPSALVPEERNVFLNPAHPDTRLVRIGRPQRFGFDARMWKGRS